MYTFVKTRRKKPKVASTLMIPMAAPTGGAPEYGSTKLDVTPEGGGRAGRLSKKLMAASKISASLEKWYRNV